jgi:DeoR/GlpR family transcriptional regulator of sugar metabolism
MHKSVLADKLATEVGVSKTRIRRDLEPSPKKSFLVRTRGGAVSIAGLRLEEVFVAKVHVANLEKALIGR